MAFEKNALASRARLAIFPAVDFPSILLSILVHDVNHSQSASVCVHRLVIDRFIFIYLSRAAGEMMMKGRPMIYDHLHTAEGCGRTISFRGL
jgi:hypothetical protein